MQQRTRCGDIDAVPRAKRHTGAVQPWFSLYDAVNRPMNLVYHREDPAFLHDRVGTEDSAVCGGSAIVSADVAAEIAGSVSRSSCAIGA